MAGAPRKAAVRKPALACFLETLVSAASVAQSQPNASFLSFMVVR
jgi:hypothetical protein